MNLRGRLRVLMCRLGLHHYQYLLAPPTWRRGDRYDPGIWCIFCNRRGPRGPGDGLPIPRGGGAPRPDNSRVAIEVPCG